MGSEIWVRQAGCIFDTLKINVCGQCLAPGHTAADKGQSYFQKNLSFYTKSVCYCPEQQQQQQ